MKKLLLTLLSAVTIFTAQAQIERYYTQGGDIMLSFADININGDSYSSIPRFSFFYNSEYLYHVDLTKNFGAFIGTGIYNTGFIFDVNDTLRKKFRTYNFGVPVGLKLGNMNGIYLYAGYELELPFHIKEKTFVNGDKTDKQTEWFSNQYNQFQQAFFVGIRLPYSMGIKFKYYTSNFFRQNYTTNLEDGTAFMPYANTKVNIFYVSLCSMLTKGKTTPPTMPYM